MGRRFVTIMFLAIAAGGAATCAGADGGGPTPGFSEGSPGILSPNGLVRYVTITTSNETLVERIGTRSGDVLNWRPLSGFYGIAYVAGDATTTGLTRDG